jgi:uncharacterized protein YbjT (DUF2867 family)
LTPSSTAGPTGRQGVAATLLPSTVHTKETAMSTVLVTGGTGLLGSSVVQALLADGHQVRVLTRHPRSAPDQGSAVRDIEGREVEVVAADLATGEGLASALAGVAAVVHCATDPRRPREVDGEGTERLLEAARAAGRPHVVYISIVGVDRIPAAYYRAKLAAERAIERSGLPWTVLRTTQFHEFVGDLVARLARLPVVPAPRGWRFQPIDVDQVARRLADVVSAGPGGRLPDLGGPESYPVVELVREQLRRTGRRRPVVEIPLPGASAAAMRAGANLVPGNRSGSRAWQEFLAGRSRATPRQG